MNTNKMKILLVGGTGNNGGKGAIEKGKFILLDSNFKKININKKKGNLNENN